VNRETILALAPNAGAAEVDEDFALVRAAKAGHLTAFEQLMRKYERIVLAVVQSIIGNREEAESTTVEAFFLAYKTLSRFPVGTKVSTWLVRIVVRESLSKLALQPVAGDEFLDVSAAKDSKDLPPEPDNWVTSPNDLYDAPELREILSNALRSVSPTARLVFVLRDIGSFSRRDISDILGLSRTTVREHLFQTRLHLRERLARYFKKPVGDADPWTSVDAPDRATFSIPHYVSQE
jgi:RNA polymerase sigma-70 factor (ECF subfamily)